MFRVTLTVRTLNALEIRARLSELAALLRDVVDGGAAVGFLPPLEVGEAPWRRRWKGAAVCCLLRSGMDASQGPLSWSLRECRTGGTGRR